MVLRIVLYSWISGLIVLGLVAYFIWAIWIARFVTRYGLKPAFFLWLWAPLLDYYKRVFQVLKVHNAENGTFLQIS